jgi:glucosylceramidase
LDEAYKQPMYYALGHFSKFIPEHSVRVYSSGVRMGPLQTLSVQKPDGSVVLVLLNE